MGTDPVTASRMALVPEVEEAIRSDERQKIVRRLRHLFAEELPVTDEYDAALDLVMDPIFKALER